MRDVSNHYFAGDPALEKIERDVLSRYPYPIAQILDLILQYPPESRHRANLERKLLQQSIKYPCLVVLSDYLASTETIGPVNDHLLSMRVNPSLGTWLDLWRRLFRSYRPAHEAAAIASRVFSDVETPNATCRSVEVQGIGIFSQLVALRNSEQHYYIADPRQWYNLLLQAVVKLQPLASLCLFRLDAAPSRAGWRATELQGAAPNRFSVQEIEIQAGLAPGVYLASDHTSPPLRLYPLIVDEPCDDCINDGAEYVRELFLFEMPVDSRLRYLGAIHPTLIDRHTEALRTCYRNKGIDAPTRHLRECASLQEACHTATERAQTHLAFTKVCSSDALIERSTGRDLDRFVSNANSGGFLLIGEPGAGKTSLLATRCQQWESDPSNVVLFIACAAREEKSLESLVQHTIDTDASLKRMLKLFRDARTAGRWIIVLDGIHDSQHSHALFASTLDFIARRSRDYSFLKVILSARELAYRRIVQTDLVLQKLNLARRYLFESDTGAETDRAQENFLSRLSQTECAEAYERYRRTASFAPLTPYDELSAEMQFFVQNPWQMRLVLTAYNGREVPPKAHVGSLLQQLRDVVEEIPPFNTLKECSRFVTALLAMMRELRQPAIEKASLFECENHVIADEMEHCERDSAYIRLLDTGLLEELVQPGGYGGWSAGMRTYIRFTHEALFDYLMADYVLNQVVGFPFDEDARRRLEAEIALVEQYPELAGYLATAMRTLIEEGHGEGLVACVLRASGTMSKRTASQALFESEVAASDQYESVVDCFCRSGATDVVLRCARSLAHHGRYAGARHAYESALAFETTEDSGHFPGVILGLARLEILANRFDRATQVLKDLLEHQSELLAGRDLANARRDLGRAWLGQGHVQNAQKALVASLKTIPADDLYGRVYLLNDMAVADIMVGNIEGAQRHGDAALRIANELGWERGLALTYNTLALNFEKRAGDGHAADSLSLLESAKESYGEALRISRRLEDRWEQVIHQNNLGVVQMKLNDPSAEKVLQSAEDLARRLGDVVGLATSLANQGALFARNGRLDVGRERMSNALEIAKTGSDPTLVAWICGNLGKMMLDLSEYDQAIENLVRAIDIYHVRGNEEASRQLESSLAMARLLHRMTAKRET